MSGIIEIKVRDYECDIQGIVNNSVYQNYIEHARHEFLLERGVDFAALAYQGINLVVVRAELDYKASLKSGDIFSVETKLVKASRIKFEFQQTIRRVSDNALCLNAKVIGAALNDKGRPIPCAELEPLFEGASD
ncbi:acyl-CoA thioesterase [Saccharophagus degradans]|uniref:acyl-CoA thioesterase n=1 Tax=Saccharophagus degradans TaxID=86304 RepID=UPI00247813DF|nr:acyl-CoA thioesterase [Saccharophagus degradans]WGO99051.1 acyl-CoA thioesterase [Saccharophagus degradans]